MSFCLLMVAGGAVTTYMVRRTISQRLDAGVERSASGIGSTLAAQLADPIAFGDWLSVRSSLRGAIRANSDIVYAFVADARGAVRVHSFLEPAFPADLVPIASRRGVVRLTTDAGPVTHVAVPIAGGVLGAIHVGVSRAWVTRAVDDAVASVLVITGAAMVVGVLGILVLAGLITRPLLGLTNAVDRFGAGDRGAEAPVTGSDEIAELSAAFNRMARQIQDRVAESEALRLYIQKVLDSVPIGVVVIADDARIEYANGRIVADRGDVVGRPYAEVFGADRPALELADGVAATSLSHVSPAGRHYELTRVPMPGAAGRLSVLETSEDVTSQREIADRLQRAERLAVAGEIAAGVVHTINNPLDGVRRAMELAATSAGDPQRVQTMLELAREGVDRIAGVTRTMLGFARPQRPAAKIPTAPNELAIAAVKLAQLKAELSAVTIELALADELPPVCVDGQAITEVLLNILLNAIDACRDAAGARGRITVTTREAGARRVAIAITDSGAGIAPDIRDKVFDPFFTTKDVGRGTGLGLSVARRITEAHGGEIVLDASAERETTFHVMLPVSSTGDDS